VSTEERLNIAHREIDIGLRNSQPNEINLAARRVGEVQYAAYAANKLELPESNSSQWLVMHGETRHRPAVRTVLERVSALNELHADLYRGKL